MKRRPPGKQREHARVDDVGARLLYSADLHPAGVVFMPDSQLTRVVEPEKQPVEPGAAARDIQRVSNELIIVDGSVPDLDALLDGFVRDNTRHFEVVMLDPSDDGLRQVTELLADRRGLSAIHLVAHGEAGAIQLGTSRLDSGELAQHAELAEAWGAALNPDGDILLYGCDVAAGDSGARFIAALSALTGADVAASTNLTGAAANGGDWKLEAEIGRIETAGLLTANAQSSWQGTLAVNTVTVTSTTDVADGDTSSISALMSGMGADGVISLREAIAAANSTANDGAGADEIHFNIAAALVGGAHTISLSSALPDITDALVIDGSTEPDHGSTPMVVLDGTSAGAGVAGLALVTGSDGSTIRGLVIQNFLDCGIVISDSSNNTIAGNYIGVAADGMTLAGNGAGGIATAGIFLGGIGITTTNNTIGGLTAADRNLIVNIGGSGVFLYSANSNTVVGNYLGLAADGSTVLSDSGIYITDSASNNIGGTVAGARNIVAGTIELSNALSTGNVVAGNYLGTDATGLVALHTNNSAVFINGGAHGNTIGGTVAGARNVIAGKNGSGMYLDGADSNTIQGNYIGLGADGSTAVGNGQSGIDLHNSTNNIVGGTAAGAGNIISGNTWDGVDLDGASSSGNIVAGNYIGTDATGLLNRANGGDGVFLYDGAHDNTIGGTAAGAGNLIAFNAFTGIGSFNGAGTGNRFLGNSIHDNGTEGIDLEYDGVSANDAGDVDGGANALQNYPVLSTAVATATQVVINGSLNSAATTTYRIEFFASATGDGNGHGEAERYLGFANVTTDGSGNATINATLTAVVAAGEVVTATATNSTTNDTSEFALNITATANPNAAPTITSNGGGASTGINVAENTTAVTTVVATDADLGDTIAYSITGGADQALFSINSSTGALTFTSGRNYEVPTDANSDGVYLVTVTADDGNGGTDTQAISVTITDANDAPVIVSNAVNSAGAETAVNSSTTGSQRPFANNVAMDASGNYVVVWYDSDAGHNGIFAQRYNAAGVAQGGAFQINTTIQTYDPKQQIFMAANGEFVVVWENDFNSNTSILARRFDANGVAHGAEILVTTDQSGDNEHDPAGAIDPSGNFVITWRADPGGGNIYAKRYDASGVAQGAAFQVNTVSGDYVYASSVGMDAVGNFTIFWMNWPSNNGLSVQAQRYDASGTSIGGNFQTLFRGPYTDTPAIAMTPSGDFVVLFNGNSNNEYAVFGEVFNAAGVQQGSDFQVHSAAQPYGTLPAIAIQSDGSFFAVWRGYHVSDDGSIDVDDGVFLRQFTANGTPLTDAIQVNTSATGVGYSNDAPSVAIDGNGHIVVVWRSTDAGNDDGVYVQRYTIGNGAAASITVNEGVTAVTTVVATDEDLPAQTLAYSISGGADAARFAVNSGTGALTFVTPPDFDAPIDADANNVYLVTVTVSDGNGGTDSQSISVIVRNSNDSPVITSNGGGATASINVAENTTAVTTVTATDVDLPAQTLGYSIVGGADAASFSINAATGALIFNAARNYESPADADANNVYLVVVQARDSLGSIDTQTISVTITDANEAPVITSNGGGSTTSVSVAENATAVTTVVATDVDAGASLSYSITGGADQALFSINSTTGVLTFTSGRNFEIPSDANSDGIYDVTVQASDGLLTDSQAISVTITDANEAPVITSNGGGATTSVSVGENATAVTTVVATDVDAGASLSYSITGGADSALFSINSTTGVLTFTSGRNFEVPSDANSDGIYDVIVQASDGSLTDTQAISVTITDANEAPVITSNGGGSTTSVSVAENATAVTTVVATDVDAGASLSYSITGGADSALFSINSTTGVLTFTSGRNFEVSSDANSDGIYDVIVQASDGSLTDTQTISVTITDANEAPVITSNGGGATANISVYENQNTLAVANVTATDPDPQTLTYSISGGADAARFSINSSTGGLSFNAPPDFDAPADANADNVYQVTVAVSDGNGGTDTQAISITVLDVVYNVLVVNSTTDVVDGNTSSIAALAGNLGADGVVSLREAILAANNTANEPGGADRILFNIPAALVGGAHTISLTSALPAITNAVVIDGTTDPDYAGAPIIVLNGTGAGAAVNGLTLNAGSAGSTVRGLVINNFSGDGIRIVSGGGHTIAGNYIGLNAAGTTAAGNAGDGINVMSASTNNTIGGTTAADRNVISGNAIGVHVQQGSTGTALTGNYIGLTASGSAAAGNTVHGVLFETGSTGNTIGGTAAGAGNVISGNGFGVMLNASSNNLIAGNVVGLAADGMTALANADDGIYVFFFSNNNTIGGTTVAARNIISGNGANGISIQGSSNTTVQGNYIGVAADGMTARGNSALGPGSGVNIYAADSNTIGGSASGAGNVIAGNYDQGIYVNAGHNNVIQGNTIGLASDGFTARGNGGFGVVLFHTAANNTIGGSAAGAGNLIASNGSGGILIQDALNNFVEGNIIGLAADGSTVRGNNTVDVNGAGVTVNGGSTNNTIGGSTTAQRNAISGNAVGVSVSGSGTTGNLVQGNYIGSDAAGFLLNRGNTQQGILITAGAANNAIGGTNAGEGNDIVFNAFGVDIQTGAGVGNSILGNRIYSNAGLGINLGTAGVTANDAGDADTGANALQNFPLLLAATSNGTQIRVVGSLNSGNNRTYRIELFASAVADATGNGEGQRYLGFATVTTDGSGNASLDVTLTATVALGEAVSATATDMGTNDTSEFALNIVVSSAPVITSNGGGATASVNVSENTTAVTNVTATDADVPAQTLSYSISGGADAALFTINSSTGVLSFLASKDYETPTDSNADNVYQVIVTASDGTLTDTQTISVTVTDANDAPVLATRGDTSASVNLTAPEERTYVVAVTSTDPDAAQTPTYSISGGADAAFFSIDASTGALSFTAARDYDTPADANADNVYIVNVAVSDGNGGSDTQTLNVAVTRNIQTTVGGETQVNSVAANSQNTSISPWNTPAQNVGIDAAGNFVVVWNDDVRDGSGYGVYAQRYDASGAALGGNFQVNNTTTGDQLYAQVAVAANGLFVVVWQYDSGSGLDVYGQRYDAAGVAQGGEFVIDAGPGTDPGVNVAMDANGNFVVAWSSTGQDGSGSAVMARRYDAAGAAQGSAFQVNTYTNGDQYRPSVAMNGSGNFVIAWQDNVQDGSFSGIYAQRFNAAGVAQGSEFRVNTTTLDAQGEPSVGMDSAGNFVVAWSHYDAGTFQIYAQRYDAAGVAQGGEFIVNTTLAAGKNTPSVAMRSTGEFFIAWQSMDQDEISGFGTYARQFDSNGNALTGETPINTTAFGGQGIPSAAISDNGQLIVVWQGFSAGDPIGVSMQRYQVSFPNTAPVITSGGGGAAAGVSVAENSTSVTTVSASDADLPAQTLIYTISGGVDQALFSINSATGVLTFISGRNFEIPADADGDGVYVVTVQASDGSLTDTQTISVTVTNANEAPVIASNGGGATANVNTAENTTTVTTATATDVDAPTTLSYSIVGGSDAAVFTINSTTGALSFIAAPNFELPADAGANNVYDVIVQASDGALTDIQALAVTVTDANDAPVITSNGGGASAGVVVAANTTAVTTVTAADADSPAQTLTYAIAGGADAGLFAMNSTSGALSFLASPNPLTPSDANGDGVYDVNVFVSDGQGGVQTQALSVQPAQPATPPAPPPPPPAPAPTAAPAPAPLPATPPAPTTAPNPEAAAPAPASSGPASPDTEEQTGHGQTTWLGATPNSVANVNFAAAGPKFVGIAPMQLTNVESRQISLSDARMDVGTFSIQFANVGTFEPTAEDSSSRTATAGSSRRALEEWTTSPRAESEVAEQHFDFTTQLVKVGSIATALGSTWWLLRSSGVLVSLIASTPGWRNLDPLPVLATDDEDEGSAGASIRRPNAAEYERDECAVAEIFDSQEKA